MGGEKINIVEGEREVWWECPRMVGEGLVSTGLRK